MKAYLNNARISPKKMNIVAGLVRGMSAPEALNILKFTPKKAAKVLYKLINSAVANAEHNFNQNATDLIISEIKVTKGQGFRRYIPISRGRAHGIRKTNSHITVMLKAQPVAEKKIATPKAK